MNKEQLLDHFATEAMKAIQRQEGMVAVHNVALRSYAMAEQMLDCRKAILDKWALKEAVSVDGIELLELTVRTERCLKEVEIFTISQLLRCTDIGLLKIPNLGRKSQKEIIEQLDARGLKLREQR
jgi:DNA-directed RNA polymerase alpha subunit